MVKFGRQFCSRVRFVLESLGLGFKFGSVCLPSVVEQDKQKHYTPRQESVLKKGKDYVSCNQFKRTGKRGQ